MPITLRLPIRRRARGFSLVEVAMVLAIAALIIAGVMLFYEVASIGQQTDETLSEVTAIQQAVASLGAGQPNYMWMSGAMGQKPGDLTIAASGQLPNKWVRSGSPSPVGLISPFGSIVAVDPSGTNGRQYFVQITGVPIKVCIQLVMQDMGPTTWVGTGAGGAYGSMSLASALQNCNTGNALPWVEWVFD